MRWRLVRAIGTAVEYYIQLHIALSSDICNLILTMYY